MTSGTVPTPRNTWYVAAGSDEVVMNKPFARRIVGAPIVMFRTADGNVVAFEDKCPHRAYPLSQGKVVEGGIRCGYHGLEFGPDGKCRHVPIQERIPPRACVRVFPVKEQRGLIWLWPGEPELADQSDLPRFVTGEGYLSGLDFTCLDGEDWKATEVHYIHVDANYMLVVDNLMDLTHVTYVHEATFQTRKAHSAERTVQVQKNQVHDLFSISGQELGYIEREGQGMTDETIDSWLDTYWYPPSAMILCHGATPAGEARSEGSCVLNVNLITPETDTSSHYFWVQCVYRGSRGDIDERVDFWREATKVAFLEDEEVLRHQQKNLEQWGFTDVFETNPVMLASDKASQLVRRIVRKAVETEQGLPEG